MVLRKESGECLPVERGRSDPHSITNKESIRRDKNMKDRKMCRLRFLTILCISACIVFLSTAESIRAYYTTRGQDIVDRNTGEKVLLQGFGLGCWLLPEGYMWGIRKLDRPWQFEEAIVDLIGEKDARTFWRLYHANFLTESDIRAMKSFGANSVRIALLASLLQPREGQPEEPPYRYSEYGFSLLDSVVTWCERQGMGLIWDMHGAPGAQNAENISDSDGEARLWTEKERYWPRLKDLWYKIAERYIDYECIIGYDLLNEPLLRRYEGISVALLRDLYVDLTDTIRTIDTEGIIFIEGDDWAQNYAMLEPMDWDPHLVIAFHSYPPTSNQAGLQRWDDLRVKYNIPLWHGETGEERWPYTMNRKSTEFLNSVNVGWSWWTHKKFNRDTQPWVCHRTEGFQNILDYWVGTGDRPSREDAKTWLFDQARKTRTDYCEFLPEMVQSLIPLSLDGYAAQMDTVAPNIYEQPDDVAVEIGDVGRLRVRSRGFPLHYVWRKNGTTILNSDQPLLILDDLTMNDDGNRYVVTVWNERGEETSREVHMQVKPFSGPRVPKTPSSPAMDGVMDEQWELSPSLPISHPVIGILPAKKDLSATFRLLWDHTHLYMLVDVIDDVKINRAHRDYFKDGIEIHIDCANNKTEYYDDNDCMFRYNWTHDLTIERGDVNSVILFAQSERTDGYVMEVAIPWAMCGISPQDGNFIGLDIHVNDNDKDRREAKLAWYSKTDDAYWNPAVFGTLRLSRID